MKLQCLSIFGNLKYLLVTLFLCFTCPDYGQDIQSKIDQRDLKAFIQTLSSVQFEGRSVDNHGQIKTQDFIVDRYKTLQLEPYSSDGYLEKFNLSQTNKGAIYLKTSKGVKLQNLEQMVYTDDIPSVKTIERQLVFGGYGTEEELNQIDVENRIVMIITNSSSGDYEIKKRLEERKANGLIYFCNDDKPFISVRNLFKNVHLRSKYSIQKQNETPTFDSQAEGIPFFYFIMLREAEVKNVMGLTKKKLVNIADRKRLRSVPVVDVSVHFEDVEKTIETANVLGVIKGESEKTIIVSAHYDHVGKEDDHYYPGADDNASGVAALLELAEEFVQYKDLKYTMVFLALSAEEVGLLGSSYHVNHPDFDPEKVVCNVNMDMISRCDKERSDCNYLYCISNSLSERLDSLVAEADQLFPQCACDYSQNKSGIFNRTDTYNFSRKTIPSLLFFTGLHNDYHTPSDTWDKIDFEVFENRVLLISEILKKIQSFP